MSADYDVPESVKEKLREIYSPTVVDHVLNPRNMESLQRANGVAGVRTPGGEIMRIWLWVDNGRITNASFWTNGCAATIASGSMAAELSKGKTIKEALDISEESIASALGGLPDGNMHCANLAAKAVKAAISNYLTEGKDSWKQLYRK